MGPDSIQPLAAARGDGAVTVLDAHPQQLAFPFGQRGRWVTVDLISLSTARKQPASERCGRSVLPSQWGHPFSVFMPERILPKRTASSAEYGKIVCKSNEFGLFLLVPSLQLVCAAP
jgi:hypothetical protein